MWIRKPDWERKVFVEFASAAHLGIDLGSISNGVPPQPDIRFAVQGSERWAELVEIADQHLARRHTQSVKTGAVSGGFFSQEGPLERAIAMKATKTYETNGSPLDLVAHYDKQYPPDSVGPDLIPRVVAPIAASMVASGVWTRIWVFESNTL